MQPASIIITNVRLITVAKAKPVAKAKGATTISGITEGHVHLVMGAVELDAININMFKCLKAISDSVSQ
jgi:hypothetical protein